jgi:hypothetical protein
MLAQLRAPLKVMEIMASSAAEECFIGSRCQSLLQFVDVLCPVPDEDAPFQRALKGNVREVDSRYRMRWLATDERIGRILFRLRRMTQLLTIYVHHRAFSGIGRIEQQTTRTVPHSVRLRPSSSCESQSRQEHLSRHPHF